MLLVGLGGIFGAISRFLLGKWITAQSAKPSHFGTWIINISGSFALGLLAILHTGKSIPEWTWLLLGTGFLGAYTTFPTFGYETIQMLHNNQLRHAVYYVSSSIVLGVIFAWLGSLMGNALV